MLLEKKTEAVNVESVCVVVGGRGGGGHSYKQSGGLGEIQWV